MARIDFHSNVNDKLIYAYRLVRKIWSTVGSGEPVQRIVMVGEGSDLKKLNELLWNFNKTDFFPHCFIEDEMASETPILLSENFSFDDIPHANVLIHLGKQIPDDVATLAARFPRIIEVVSIAEVDRLAGRERYKRYRDLGHELHNFDQSKS